MIHVQDSADGDGGIASKWWFWTAIGGTVAVATATGLTVWLLTKEDDTSTPDPMPPMSETGSVKVGFPPWFSQ